MDVIAIAGLIVATIIGIWQIYLAHKQAKLAEKQTSTDSDITKPAIIPSPLLDKEQLTWIRALAVNSQRSERVDTRQLIVSLRDALPKDFDPARIDSRFCAGGNRITLFGRALLNRNDHHVQQVNLMAHKVRKLLIQQPNRTVIMASEVAHETGLPEQEVALILESMAGYNGGGYFHNSGTSYGSYGWASINIDDDVLKRYINFESVEKLVENILRQK